MDPLTPKVISVLQAAQLLCITTMTVRNMIEDGRLEAVQIGRTWAVSLDSVDAEFARRYPDFVRRTDAGKE